MPGLASPKSVSPSLQGQAAFERVKPRSGGLAPFILNQYSLYSLAMGPRIYTPREANALVPKLTRAFDDIDQIRNRLKTIKGKVDVLEMIWGEEVKTETNPDFREYTHYMEEIEQAKKDFDSSTRKFGEFEAVVKSIDQGLIDFYGVIENRLVFL